MKSSTFCGMRSILAAASFVAVAAWANAQATLPLYEPFDYSDGNLVGNSINGGTWTQTGTNTASPVQVSAGSLTYPGLPSSLGGKVTLINASSAEDPGLNITNQTAGTLYVSFILNVTNPGNTTGDYFFHFAPQSGSSNFRCSVFIRQGSSSSKYQLGLHKLSQVASAVWTATEYDVGTPVLITVAYVFSPDTDDDICYLWVNPPLKQPSPPTPTLTMASGTDSTGLGRVCLRQGSGNVNLNLQLDELRVSNSWGDVTLPVALSSWSLE